MLFSRVAIGFSLLCGTAFSAAEAITTSVVNESEIEKTDIVGYVSKAYETQFEVDHDAYTGNVQSVERSQFESQFTTLDHLLGTLPGVQFRKSGGVGSFGSLSLRGSSGKQVNFFLDGLLLNSPFSGSVNLATIPSTLIERVDVYSSFTPIELSTANLAGAVNFTSRHVKNIKPALQASLTYGSFQTLSADLSSWGQAGDWELMAAGNYLQSENDYAVDDDAFKTTSDTRINDQIDSESVFIKAAREWEQARLQFLYQFQNLDKGVPTQLNRLVDNANLAIESQQLQTVVDYALFDWQLSHRLFYAKETTDFDDPRSTVGLFKDHIITDQDGYGVFTLAKYAFEHQALIFGINLREDHVFQEYVQSDQVKADVSRQSTVLSAAHHWNVTETFFLNTTLRHYAFSDDIHQHPSVSLIDDQADATAWQLGAKINLTSSLLLLANIGQTVRMPTLLEKFGNTGEYIGNDELKEEVAQVVDIGLQYRLGVMQLETSFYAQDISDGIYMIYDSRGIGRPENIGQAFIWGNDSKLLFQLTDQWILSVNSSLKDTENQSDIKAFTGKKLPGIYHVNYGSELAYNIDWFSFSTTYQYYDLLYYNPANGVKGGAKPLWDASATFYFSPLTLDFTVQNLLDERVMDFNRSPASGRAFFITATLNF